MVLSVSLFNSTLKEPFWFQPHLDANISGAKSWLWRDLFCEHRHEVRPIYTLQPSQRWVDYWWCWGYSGKMLDLVNFSTFTLE